MDDMQRIPSQPSTEEPATAPESRPSDGLGDGPITIRSAEDILAYIPHALGDWPRESLVAVALCDGQLGASLRIDLPATRRPAVLERFAGTVARYVGQDPRAAGAVLALYTSEPWHDPAHPPHSAVLDAVRSSLADAGLPVLDVWIVGEEHWRTASCAVPTCCPWPGAPTGQLRMGRISAEMVFRGSSYGKASSLPAARPTAAPPAAATAAALEAYRENPDRWWEPYAFTAALAAWDDALSESAVPSPDRLRLLGVTLIRPALRDAVMVSAAAGASTAWLGSAATAPLRASRPGGLPPALPGGLPAAEVAAALDSWWDGEGAMRTNGLPVAPGGGVEAIAVPVDRASGSPAPFAPGVSSPLFGRVLLGATASAPDWGRIAVLDRVVQALAETEAPEVRAPALTILAWIQWIRGRGSRCHKLLERALSADPDYRLAQLLRRVVEHGELPAWARSRDTAWQRPTGTADAA
jgi:hypothetical protein